VGLCALAYLRLADRLRGTGQRGTGQREPGQREPAR